MEARKPAPLHYPEDDGNRLAENTAQFDWIVLLKENLDVWLPDFVAADLLWYPVEGDVQTRAAPDVMVALGRPKGSRGSYLQWQEEGIAPQVVFEVLSPGNTAREMNEKRHFYERFGVKEYLVIDPDQDAPERALFEVWVRRGQRLQLADFEGEYHSALLGVRLVREQERLLVRYPDGRPFLTTAQRQAQSESLAAERDAVAAENARLRERLRALGIDPDAP
jgi:Uma2 family endonuclease